MSNFPEYLDFAEERLELGIDYGAVGGISFKTEIIETSDGSEIRIPQWHLPLGRWQLGDRMVADSELDKLEEVTYLKDFHEARKGGKQAFRFKDWADYQGTGEEVGTGDNVQTEWQLKKWYRVGASKICRPITKPVEGTVKIYFDDIEQELTTVWTIDHTSGLIRFVNPVPDGVSITSDFEYDVPVCFETDEIGFNLQAVEGERKLYRLESVFVKEIRYPINFFISPEKIDISETLDLGIIYDSIESIKFNTSKQDIVTGYSRKDDNWTDGKFYLNLGVRAVDETELKEILNYFWVAQGKANSFTFKYLGNSYISRFDVDSINLKFNQKQNQNFLFNLSGLKLKLEEIIIFDPPPFTFRLEPIFVDPTDPNDPNLINSGFSGGGGGGGGNGGGGGGGSAKLQLSLYKSETVEIDRLPVGASANPNGYYIANSFWAAGKLHVFLSSNFSGSSYHRRLAHYAIDPRQSWNFQYQEDSSFYLKDYLFSLANASTVLLTPTGVSMFLVGTDDYPLGTSGTNYNKGVVRFEIKDDGSFLINLMPYNGNTAVRPHALYGDKVFLQKSGTIVDSLGTLDGLSYFYSSISNGFPVGSSVTNPLPTGIDRYMEGNVWLHTGTLPESKLREINHTNAPFFSYYPSSTGNLPILYFFQNQNGAVNLRARLRNYCEDAFGCSDDLDLTYFFQKSNYLAEPVQYDIQNTITISSLGDSYYIQRTISGFVNIDDYGNIIQLSGSKLVYYHNGSGYGIDISTQIGFLAGYIKSIQALTPYGFAVFGQSRSNLFDSNNQILLSFIQSKNV